VRIILNGIIIGLQCQAYNSGVIWIKRNVMVYSGVRFGLRISFLYIGALKKSWRMCLHLSVGCDTVHAS